MIREIKKNLHLPGLCGSVLVLMILMGLAEGAVGEDGTKYSLFNLMELSGRLDLKNSTRFCWPVLWNAGMGQWVKLVAPTLISLGFIRQHTEERLGGAELFMKVRQRRLSFALRRVLGAMVSAGVILALSYALFGLVLLAFFPLPSRCSSPSKEILVQLYGSNMLLFALKHLGGVFLFGVFASLIPVLLGSVVSDRFLIMALPFLLAYLYERVFQRLLYFSVISDKKREILMALDMENLCEVFLGGRSLLAVGCLFFLCVLCFLGYYWLNFGRRDETG